MKKNAGFDSKSSDWIGIRLKARCVNSPLPARESRGLLVPGTLENILIPAYWDRVLHDIPERLSAGVRSCSRPSFGPS